MARQSVSHRVMSGEYYDQINELILKNGRITNDELGEIISQDESLNTEKVELLYEELAEMGVQIVDAAKAALETDERRGESGDFFSKEEIEDADNLRLDDSVKMYLKTIGQISLLTPQEEIYYARRYRDGDSPWELEVEEVVEDLRQPERVRDYDQHDDWSESSKGALRFAGEARRGERSEAREQQ